MSFETRGPPDETYEACVKLVLLLYQNEPRFKVPALNIVLPSTTATPPVAASKEKKKRTSWFHRSHADPNQLPKDFVPLLKQRLSSNKNVNNQLTKKCMAAFQAELAASAAPIDTPEQLMVRYISCVTKQVQSVSDTDLEAVKKSVYSQSNIFVNVAIEVLKPMKHTDLCIQKLKEFDQNLKSTAISNAGPRQAPTYRVSEITNIKLIGRLFSKDDLTLQTDIDRFKNLNIESCLYTDLHKCLSMLNSNEFQFKTGDFASGESFMNWKFSKQNAIKRLIDSLPPIKFNNLSDGGVSKFYFLPNDQQEALSQLYKRLLSLEPVLSNSSKQFFNECCKYWLMDDIQTASICYDSANSSVLRNEELLPEQFEAMFINLMPLIETKSNSNPQNWPIPCKLKWISNLEITYNQVMTSCDNLLTAIFSEKAPKFTPVLRVYYSYIEPDIFFNELAGGKVDLQPKWLTKFNSTILKTTEMKYVELLSFLPNDNTLNYIDLKNLVEKIYKLLESLQKKFPKPLFDCISITKKSCLGFIELLSQDLKNLIKHVESYNKVNFNREESSLKLDYSSGLELYNSIKDLKDIFTQISNEDFPIDIDKIFYKYLLELCTYSCEKLLPMVKTSVKQDDFKSIDLENGIGYSISVVDIFKMFNETLSMFNSISWENQQQFAGILTNFTKSLSECLVFYSNYLMDIVSEDLNEDQMVEGKQKHNQSLSNNSSNGNSKRNTWLFNDMKAVISSQKNKLQGQSQPQTEHIYSFKDSTCVIVNNLSICLKKLEEIENKIDPESIVSLLANSNNGDGLVSTAKPRNSSRSMDKNLFTIKINKCENLKPCNIDGTTDSFITITDNVNRRQIGKTKLIQQSLNPIFNEEFELETLHKSGYNISINVWNHHKGKFGSNSNELLGRVIVDLNSRNFSNDGFINEFIKSLEIQGEIFFEISMETERTNNAIFNIGKANRSLNRSLDKSLNLIVEKFSKQILNSFSKHTLKQICGSSGYKKPSVEAVNDAIVPLFDYLNMNLQILANILDNSLLIQLMLNIWKIVLNVADSLLLPNLSSCKTSMINDHHSIRSAVANVVNSSTTIIPNYGRALTAFEVKSIFIWLNSLCYDFFYNDGAGPPLDDLRNEHYQSLLLIPEYYEKSVRALLKDFDELNPTVLRALRDRNSVDINIGSSSSKTRQRASTIARSQTVAAHGSAKKRAEIQQELKETQADSSIAIEDIILRILIAKGEKDFVKKRLKERERLSSSLRTEMAVKRGLKAHR